MYYELTNQTQNETDAIHFNKDEQSSSSMETGKLVTKCYLCGNEATIDALYIPSNKRYPVCSKCLEKVKGNEKWRVEES